MTAQVQYETSGPLSVCPCCGDKTAPADSHPNSKSCERCWRLVGHIAYCASTRADMAQRGVELRVAGKLPPLPETRWGVWCAKQSRWSCHDSDDTCVGTRDQAESWCRTLTGRAPSFGWTVKPYPGEQTSEVGRQGPAMTGASPAPPRTETAPPLPVMTGHNPASEGGAAKVDEWETWAITDNGKLTLKINGAKVDPCATCGGRGEIGGFESGGAPGYVTEPCPECRPKKDPYAAHNESHARRRDNAVSAYNLALENRADAKASYDVWDDEVARLEKELKVM